MKIACVIFSLLFFIPSLFALYSYFVSRDQYALDFFINVFPQGLWGVLGFYICHKEGD